MADARRAEIVEFCRDLRWDARAGLAPRRRHHERLEEAADGRRDGDGGGRAGAAAGAGGERGRAGVLARAAADVLRPRLPGAEHVPVAELRDDGGRGGGAEPAAPPRVLVHDGRRRLHPLPLVRQPGGLQEGPHLEAAVQDRYRRDLLGAAARPQEVQALRAEAARVHHRYRSHRLRLPRLRRQAARDVRPLLAGDGAGGARAPPRAHRGLRLRAAPLRLLGPPRYALLGLRLARAQYVQRGARRRRRRPAAAPPTPPPPHPT